MNYRRVISIACVRHNHGRSPIQTRNDPTALKLWKLWKGQGSRNVNRSIALMRGFFDTLQESSSGISLWGATVRVTYCEKHGISHRREALFADIRKHVCNRHVSAFRGLFFRSGDVNSRLDFLKTGTVGKGRPGPEARERPQARAASRGPRSITWESVSATV